VLQPITQATLQCFSVLVLWLGYDPPSNHLHLKEQCCVELECGNECRGVKAKHVICTSFLISKIWRLALESLKPNDTHKIGGRTHYLYILFEDLFM
jgi:hypothetical protein